MVTALAVTLLVAIGALCITGLVVLAASLVDMAFADARAVDRLTGTTRRSATLVIVCLVPAAALVAITT